MAFDGLVIKGIINELNKNILNSRVEKIYQPDQDEILIKLYGTSGKSNLRIVTSSDNYRIHLTNSIKNNPFTAPNFCMVLRKYLSSGRIRNIYTNGLERTVFINFDTMSEDNNLEKYTLAIELMGKYSNVILINSDNIIINSLKHFRKDEASERNILPGYKYEELKSDKYDLTQNPTADDFINFVNNVYDCSQNVAPDLLNIFTNEVIGISKPLVKSALAELNLDNITSENSIREIYNYLYNLYLNVENLVCINYDQNYTVKLTANKEDVLQINNFIDKFYENKEESQNFILYRNSLLKLILNKVKKLTNKLANVNKKMAECNNMDTYKLYGELIVNNMYKLDNSHLDSISLNNYYTGEDITIPLDKSLSPYNNAQKYFKKYNKLKNALSFVKEQENEIQEQLSYLESIVYELEASNTIEEVTEIYDEISNNVLIKDINAQKKNKVNVKKKKPNNRIYKFDKEQFIRFKIDDFDVFVGKNNVQNDYLTLKFASDNDLWFHTKDIHGSHVILRIHNEKPSQEIINKVASIAAKYSKAKFSSNVPVDYTYVKYVKKPNKAKPGMVIYTYEQTVNVQPEK